MRLFKKRFKKGAKKKRGPSALCAPEPEPEPRLQPIPWGIERIQVPSAWATNTADPIKVGIIDTGISRSHPDLSANLKGCVSFVRRARNCEDDNGHGSHVASIVSAVNDSDGVVGAAPAADLYAIKALDHSGSGWLSDIIAALDYAIEEKIQILNLSLGTTSDVAAFKDAIQRAASAGITLVAAAGNNGSSVNYPAAYPEVIAVSATDENNNLASFSSRGSAIDLAAPGVSIYSSYKRNGYATLSGTSMAAPHVAAALALLLNSPVGSADNNLDGNWNAEELLAQLKKTATDLGAIGIDPLFGAGLVNVAAALGL